MAITNLYDFLSKTGMPNKNFWDKNKGGVPTLFSNDGMVTTSAFEAPPPPPATVAPPPPPPPTTTTPPTTTQPTFTRTPPPPPSYTDMVEWEYKTVWNQDTGVPEIWRRKPGGTITDPNDPNYGKPIYAGQWEKDPTAKDYTDLYNQIRGIPGEMEERGLSSFQDWIAERGYTQGDVAPYLQYLSDLKDKLNGGQAAQDEIDAWNSAAAGMGLTGDQLTNIIGSLTLKVSGKTVDTANMTPQELQDYYTANPDAQEGIIGSQPGLSPEELALRERMARNSTREMQKSSQKMLDNALGSSNSRARYLMQADQYMTQIRDQDLQQQLAISQEDSDRRQQEYQATLQTWGSMYQAGQMGKQQFLDNVRQNRSLELQITATEISTVMQQNQQYLQEYGADLQAFEIYSQNVFNAVNSEMGMDQGIMDMTTELYNQSLAPYLAQMTEWESQMALYQDSYNKFVDTELTPYLTAQTNAATLAAGATSGVIEVLGAILGLFFGAIL